MWIEWKWSNGDVYEKSKRQNQNQSQNQSGHERMDLNLDAIKENDAYLQSLNVDNHGWDTNNTSFLENQFYIKTEDTNRREDSYSKIAERELVSQGARNPFLDNGNYVNDVTARDMFLKPLDTNTDKETFDNM